MLSYLALWVLIGIRILTVLMTAPVLGHRVLSPWYRFGLAAMLTLMAGPVILSSMFLGHSTNIRTLSTLTEWIEAFLSEAFLGALLGFGMSLLFLAAAMGGGVIGQMAGIQLFANESEETASPMCRLFSLISIAIFVSIGGIEMVVSGVLDSFATLPLGAAFQTSEPGSLVHLLVELCRQSFLLVFRCIAPTMLAMLITTYLVGMLNRALPSLNSMGIGLTSNLAIMMISVLLTLGGTLWLIMSDWTSSGTWVQQIIENMRPE